MFTIVFDLFYLLFFFTLATCDVDKVDESSKIEGSCRIHFQNLEVDTRFSVNDYNFGIWYNDDAIILESVVIMSDLIPDVTSDPAYQKILSFVYYDYIHSRAMAFSEFQHQLSPELSFTLKDSEFFYYDFMGKNKGKLDSTFEMSDTAIDGNIFKRRFSERFNNVNERTRNIYYLKKEKRNIPVHLNAAMDRKFYPYRVYRVESYFNDKLVQVSYQEIISARLSSNEKKIFETWKRKLDSSDFSFSFLDFKKYYSGKLNEEFIQKNK